MRLGTWLVAVGVVGALSWAGGASAQDARDLDTHRFTPSLDANGFLGVPGTSTPGSMRPTFGLFLDYAYQPYMPGNIVTNVAHYYPSVEHRVAANVSAQLGLGSRAAVGVLVPAALYQTGADLTLQPGDSGPPDLAPAAVGDPLLSARYRLLGAASDDPLLPKDGPGLGVELRGRVPVGADSALLGAGTTRLGARLLFDMQLLGAGIGGMVGYEGHVHPRHIPKTRVQHALELGAGVKVPLPSLHPFSAVGELRGLFYFQAPETTVLEGEIGLRAALEEWTLTLTGGGAFIGELGAPDARIIFGVWYAPAVSDTDHDGVDDDDDKCPPLAEDPDGFEDADGCPDPDNDNDIVPDIDDLCPNVEALEGQDDDEDGCTDAPKPAG